jgi:hypothetical protein
LRRQIKHRQHRGIRVIEVQYNRPRRRITQAVAVFDMSNRALEVLLSIKEYDARQNVEIERREFDGD